MSLIEAYQTLRKNIMRILLCSFLVGILSGIYSLIITPTYKSTVVLSSPQSSLNIPQIGGLGGLIGNISPFSANLGRSDQDIKALLKGDTLYKIFIQENNLLPKIFEDDWDEKSQTWIGEEKDHWDGIKALKNTVTSRYDYETNKTYIDVIWSDPYIAAEWANEIAMLANRYITDSQIRTQKNTIDRLNQIIDEPIPKLSLKNELSVQLEDLLARNYLKQAETSLGLTIFEEAMPRTKRFWPKRSLIVILGLLVGGFGSSVFFVLRTYFITRRNTS